MRASTAIPLAAVAMLCATSPARAETKFEIGGRLAYGIPLGKLDGSDDDTSDLSDAMKGQVPVWLDIGARITPNFFLGGYLGLGLGIPGDPYRDLCDFMEASGADCSLTAVDVRLGIQAQYHFAPGRTDPWIGAGLGYEVAAWGFELKGGGEEADLSFGASGFEFLNLQAGVDFPVSKKVGIGPFATFSLAQYSDVNVDCSGDCDDFVDRDYDIDDKALHEWLFLGARITVVP